MEDSENHEADIQTAGVTPKRRGPKPGFKKLRVVEQAVEVEKGGHTADASIAGVDTSLDRNDYAAEIERIRSIRKPFGSFTQKLALPQRPGYHRHWFNDFPGRVDEAKLSGWTHIKDQGRPIKRIVGSGRQAGALYAYAMEIPSIFWEEDQQRGFERAQSVMDELKNSPMRAKAGEVKRSDREKFYTPREIEIRKD